LPVRASRLCALLGALDDGVLRERMRRGCATDVGCPWGIYVGCPSNIGTNNRCKIARLAASVLRKPTRTTHTHGRKCTQHLKENEVRYCSEALRRLASPGYGLAGRAAASTILLSVEELPRYAIDASGPQRNV
jgi:hypothetical protein